MKRIRAWATNAAHLLLVSSSLLSACGLAPDETARTATGLQTSRAGATQAASLNATPLPTRAPFKPGELVAYVAQSGDTLPALAARFNTSEKEIRAANPDIPLHATTMPPGMPMSIPIYYRALWGSAFQILPDSAFVNGPAVVGFNTPAFVAGYAGWLNDYSDYPSERGATRSRARLSGAEIVDYVAANYSISPRLLLAILEYQGGALSRPTPPVKRNLLGLRRRYYETPYLQLVLAANTLNNGYYGWRSGERAEFELLDGSILRPDPWQNAGSVAIQYYFAQVSSGLAFDRSTGASGLYQTYVNLFGDPWLETALGIPGSLAQPELALPFPPGQVWTYTGGPHTGFGSGAPFAAIDFAPPSERAGCFIPEDTDFATAMVDGLVVRSEVAGLALDLDMDGDERTGWVIFYLHLAAQGRASVGTELRRGEFIGYPSCEGGHATGTHVHIARKFNGEWILADGPLALELDGWRTYRGEREYLGTLAKGGSEVIACECSNQASEIWVGRIH
jgi:murein DD-endopeptidase MepM/ murein hydrolase activator NlpD